MTDKDPLFEAKQHALDKAFHTCPKCGQALQIKSGKSGPFYGCTGYPGCDFTRATHPEAEQFEGKLIPDSECPECGGQLAVKHGRYGMFIGCSNYPSCQHIEHQTEDVKQEADIACPKCKKGHIHSRQSRYGKTFYACDHYPKCKFAVNHQPVIGECQTCHFPLLLKRKMASGDKLQCADKKCGAFQE